MRKYEPDVDHLDVGGLGQAAGDADEQGGEHQEGGQVHRHRRLEEEVLEEVGRVDYGEDKDGRQVDGQDGVQDSSLEDQGHLDSFVPVGGVDVCERPEMRLMIVRSIISRKIQPVGDDVLGEDGLGLHVEKMRSDRHHGGLELPHDQIDCAHLAQCASV